MTLTFGPRIPYDGGPCPVAPDTIVKVWFANGDESSKPKTAGSWWWEYAPPARGYLIIAYAVAQPETPAPEPWTPYNNRVQTGLLSDAELAALKAHKGPWEYSTGGDMLEPVPAGVTPNWGASHVVYRAVKTPETREVVMHLAHMQSVQEWTAAEGTTKPEAWPWAFTLTLDANCEPVAVGNLRRKDAAP